MITLTYETNHVKSNIPLASIKLYDRTTDLGSMVALNDIANHGLG